MVLASGSAKFMSGWETTLPSGAFLPGTIDAAFSRRIHNGCSPGVMTVKKNRADSPKSALSWPLNGAISLSTLAAVRKLLSGLSLHKVFKPGYAAPYASFNRSERFMQAFCDLSLR